MHDVEALRARREVGGLWHGDADCETEVGVRIFSIEMRKKKLRPCSRQLIVRRKNGWHLKRSQRRLEGNRRRLEGNRRRLEVDVFLTKKKKKNLSTMPWCVPRVLLDAAMCRFWGLGLCAAICSPLVFDYVSYVLHSAAVYDFAVLAPATVSWMMVRNPCRGVWEQRRLGGGVWGVWNPKVCVPMMAQINLSSAKCHCCPLKYLDPHLYGFQLFYSTPGPMQPATTEWGGAGCGGMEGGSMTSKVGVCTQHGSRAVCRPSACTITSAAVTSGCTHPHQVIRPDAHQSDVAGGSKVEGSDGPTYAVP